VQTEDVRLTAFTLAGALNWTARWYREDGAMRRDEVAARMVDILCAGLVPRRACGTASPILAASPEQKAIRV
jgi:hypothetical protein